MRTHVTWKIDYVRLFHLRFFGCKLQKPTSAPAGELEADTCGLSPICVSAFFPCRSVFCFLRSLGGTWLPHSSWSTHGSFTLSAFSLLFQLLVQKFQKRIRWAQLGPVVHFCFIQLAVEVELGSVASKPMLWPGGRAWRNENIYFF